MHNIRKITEDVIYVGASDRRLALFENVYPIERGVSYNSYLVIDEKTVLLDTVDHSVSREFLDNIEYALDGRKKYCQCKAGPQTINKDDVDTILGHFKRLIGKARLDRITLQMDDMIRTMTDIFQSMK